MKYKAIRHYKDAPSNPITVVKGECLEFIEMSDFEGHWPNWVLCRGEDKKGWIPEQYIEISGSEVTCLADYTAREHNLIPGEILISEKVLNGWIWGYKEGKDKILAWAPLNYLQKL